jgi:Tfp pilus assembly protein PilF
LLAGISIRPRKVAIDAARREPGGFPNSAFIRIRNSVILPRFMGNRMGVRSTKKNSLRARRTTSAAIAGHSPAQGSRPIELAPSASSPAPSRGRVLAACGVLCLAVGLVFGQTLAHEFIDLDDGEYVVNNPRAIAGVTLEGIAGAFTDGHFDWYPLSALSHMLDCQLYGLNPAGHHSTNVVLHAATAVALLLVLLRMTANFWPSFLAAAVFAVHPLRAESVAWVAERKDVLSGLFFMLTLAAYVAYARRRFSWARYLLVVVLFALGLMSKAMLVTLPLVLLLLDYWPLGRARDRESNRAGAAESRRCAGFAVPWHWLAEKIPLMMLAAGVSLITVLTQNSASPMIDRLPLPARVFNALVWYVVYLVQIFVPVSLAPFNIIPRTPFSSWQLAGALVVLIVISASALRLRQRCPYLIVGWLWYLIMLLPVIGLIPVGTHGMADRYTYLTHIGLYVALAWGAADLAKTWSIRPWAVSVAGSLMLTTLMGLAWRQVSYWRDSDTLWNHTLACTSDLALTHANRAQILVGQGQLDKAIGHYRRALEIDPDDAAIHNNFGTVLGVQGRVDEALVHYLAALQIRPDFAGAHYNLAVALLGRRELDAAIGHFERAVELQPKFAETHFNLGLALAQQGRLKEASLHFRNALQLQPRHAEAHYGLATVLFWQGKLEEAVSHYRRTLEINPNHPRAQRQLTVLMADREKLAGALQRRTE